MKKSIVILAGILFAYQGMAMNLPVRPADKETRQLARKERQAERRQESLHTPDWATDLQFHSDFPNAVNITWNCNEYLAAHFTDADGARTAYYNNDQKLVGTTKEVSMDLLPEKALLRIKKEWPTATISSVILFDQNEIVDEGLNLFTVGEANKDSYFALLENNGHDIVLQVDMDGTVSYFSAIR